MTFRFGLFRFLTIGNTIVLSFFGLILFMAMFINPMAAMFSLLLIIAAFLHNWNCLSLQRHYLTPGTPVKPGLPMAINLTSIGAFIWGISIVTGVINTLRTPATEMQKTLKQMIPKDATAEEKQLFLSSAHASVNIALILVGIHAITIIVNCIISIQYSRQLRAQLPEEEETQDGDNY
jgi:succinate dehydrogenase hydrophobic anchor subunit